MLDLLGLASLDELVDRTVPRSIRLERPLDLPPAASEWEVLCEIRGIADQNEVWRSYIGLGYHGTITPPVVQRNILENPGWYTQYTPYQAEISQGRLEALLAFQTMVSELTDLPVANASLLDEGTAAAEAMHLCFAVNRRATGHEFLVDRGCHPQTIAVVETRAKAVGIDVRVGDPRSWEPSSDTVGVLVAYPDTDGRIRDHRSLVEKAHAVGALVVCVTDPLALVLLEPPGAWGADVAVGSTQRFGVPMGYGGPHAAFLATRDAYKRQMPGRLVGVSIDQDGGAALRLALQTREQHIRRDKATSNICTAQVLLAIMAAMYAVYHGPDGLVRIAARVRRVTGLLAAALTRLGYAIGDEPFFDTLKVEMDAARREAVLAEARARKINLRRYDDGAVGVSLDETVLAPDLEDLIAVFAVGSGASPTLDDLADEAEPAWPAPFARTSPPLRHGCFAVCRSEHEFLRYVHRLQGRDLSLTTSMIPLGSCTMKLNATAEMLPITWPAFASIHPFAPVEQAQGYRRIREDLERWLAEITGFTAVSLQPNAGAQGEYTGMLVIRAYQAHQGEGHRDVCLIPQSAHGTNPASAVMAGMKVVVVACDAHGNVDVADLAKKAAEHRERLSAIMVTYPSTHGVFEEDIREITRIVHDAGGQVYLDGANMNAQVGICRPADYGADVCHLNLHKTFCIPHGGGGPGMGPIGVAEHLAPFLPGHPVVPTGGREAIGPVAAAPWGSPGILPIPWVYVRLMGADGLRRATEVAILNANYMAKRLSSYFPILYRGARGMVAHEFILDMRHLKHDAGVTVEDVAKRLMDYGFHAPTVSFPVHETLMVEPTESEPKAELDRLCDALIAIRGEIDAIERGEMDRDDNPLKNAPHTSRRVTADAWSHPYSREQAAFPVPWMRDQKFWPPVARIDGVYGDKNLVCTCPPVETWAGASV